MYPAAIISIAISFIACKRRSAPQLILFDLPGHNWHTGRHVSIRKRVETFDLCHKNGKNDRKTRSVRRPGATQKRPRKVVLTSYTLLYNLIYSLGRWFTAFNRGEGTYLELSGVSMIYARRDESDDSGLKNQRYLHTWIERVRFVILGENIGRDGVGFVGVDVGRVFLS